MVHHVVDQQAAAEATSGASAARTSSAPARLAARCAASSPDWSATGGRAAARGRPRPSQPASAGDRRRPDRERRAPGRPREPAGRGPRRHRHEQDAPLPPAVRTAPRGPPARTRSEPRASGRVRSCRPSSFQATIACRTGPSYGATAHAGGRPGGHGTGRCGGRSGRATRRSSGTSAGPGRLQPPQESGQTRSRSAASAGHPAAVGQRSPHSCGARRHCDDSRDAAACGRAAGARVAQPGKATSTPLPTRPSRSTHRGRAPRPWR